MKIYIFNINKIFFWLIIAVFSTNSVYSQQDSMKKRTVLITSIFKPVLKEAAKINLTATPASVDTSKPKLNYNIPNQNLLFPYSPASIKPLALEIDLGGVWQLSNSIKAGFGNLKSPLLQAGFSFGDGIKKGLQIFSNHISSTSKNGFQNYNETKIGASGFYTLQANHELHLKFEISRNNYDHLTSNTLSSNVQQRFLSWNTNFGYRNKNPTRYGVIYHPEISAFIFNDYAIAKSKEQHIKIVLPFEKQVGKSFAVNLSGNIDFINYENEAIATSTNTVFSVNPSVHLKTPKLNLRVGIRPTWDNQTFKFFPDISAEVSTDDSRFVFQAGWIGTAQVNSYQNLTSKNQWVQAPYQLRNTWKEERYAGFRGSVGKHINYSTKLKFNKFHQLPLFDPQRIWTMPPKIYNILFEPTASMFQINAEFGYTVQEKLSILATVNHYQYAQLAINKKPLGLIPFELKAAFRLKVGKDVWLSSDLIGWKGADFRSSPTEYMQLKGALDVKAGVEYRMAQKINIWVQCNNILNQDLQRWNLFPSYYGFNFVAGVIFAFDKNKK
ncbi:MAG: hypothetical protein EPO57_01980 [Chitinophagaceae bacterium]|nr:MAG: hypothetical protein EPO57_01980 [Chitinophagaceae bacterium]